MQGVAKGTRPRLDKTRVAAGWCELLSDCWHADPTMRPSFDDIITRLHDLPADPFISHSASDYDEHEEDDDGGENDDEDSIITFD